MKAREQSDHWLARPSTVKRIWRAFWGLLALSVAAQLAISIKGHFRVDGWLGFGAAFGFLSCLAMVLAAKGLGYLLKRHERYYDQGEEPADDA